MSRTDWSLAFWLNLENINNRLKIFKKPFFHAVIDDFFTEEALRYLRITCDNIEPTYFAFHDKYPYRNAVCPSKIFYSFIKCHKYSDFLKKLINITVKPCKDFPYPQYYVFDRGNDNALKVHTDLEANISRAYTSLVYLHENWQPEFGGCLQLHISRKTNSVVKLIVPKPNRLVFFAISERSFHSTQSCQNHFIRKNLVVDWDKG